MVLRGAQNELPAPQTATAAALVPNIWNLQQENTQYLHMSSLIGKKWEEHTSNRWTNLPGDMATDEGPLVPRQQAKVDHQVLLLKVLIIDTICWSFPNNIRYQHQGWQVRRQCQVLWIGNSNMDQQDEAQHIGSQWSHKLGGGNSVRVWASAGRSHEARALYSRYIGNTEKNKNHSHLVPIWVAGGKQAAPRMEYWYVDQCHIYRFE